MYRNLIDFYVLSVELLNLKRQKNHNNHVLIFEFHEFNFNNVIIEIQIDIKNLNRDCMFQIKNTSIMILILIIAFLKNMK